VHEALVFEDVSKVFPDTHQPWVHALPALLAAPPIVFAASQKCQPPEIQAGGDGGLSKGFLGGHVHGCLLLVVHQRALFFLKNIKPNAMARLFIRFSSSLGFSSACRLRKPCSPRKT
jgi:hypothetical protein